MTHGKENNTHTHSRFQDVKRVVQRASLPEYVERVQEGLGALVFFHLADEELRRVQHLLKRATRQGVERRTGKATTCR